MDRRMDAQQTEAMRLQREERLREFKASLDRGIDDSDNNRGRPMKDVVDELLASLASGFAERQPAEHSERRSVGPQDPGTELRGAESA